MTKYIRMNGVSGIKKAYATGGKIRKPKSPVRILAKDVMISADERALANLNCLLIGASGMGKTRGYVSPNIAASENESMIVLDSKLNLYKKHKTELEEKGYKVDLIDLVDLSRSTCGYNPLSYVRTVGEHGQAKADDVKEIAQFIAADDLIGDKHDPLWHTAARNYIAACISLAFHVLPEEDHTLTQVNKLLSLIDQPAWAELIAEAEADDPECLEVIIDQEIRTESVAEKMSASIQGIAKNAMGHFVWDEANELYNCENQIRFSDLGDRKMAVFVNVPDHDFSKGPLLSMFFSQCIKDLLDHADQASNSRLRHPVHLYCDDIGSSFCLPHLPELLSVIRSRSVSISLIVQSWTQIVDRYGLYAAMSIAGNCSIVSYLGGMELESPKFLSERADIPPAKIMSMAMDTELLLIQCQKPCFVKKTNAEDYKPLEFIEQYEEQPLQPSEDSPEKEVG